MICAESLKSQTSGSECVWVVWLLNEGARFDDRCAVPVRLSQSGSVEGTVMIAVLCL